MTDSWDSLIAECGSCTACRLAEGRTNVVFGVGDRHARLMFVGEGPGEQEDLRGEPFVGPAGKLLDRYLAAIGLDRERVYIANIVKCRTPHNPDPEPGEAECCMRFLRRQVKLIDPDIIVCLGRVAACRMIDESCRITAQHGQWVQRGKFHMTATFHPAALLRAPDNKPAAFDDFLSIRSKMRELGIWNGDDV